LLKARPAPLDEGEWSEQRRAAIAVGVSAVLLVVVVAVALKLS
jgi:hypothetical protein